MRWKTVSAIVATLPLLATSCSAAAPRNEVIQIDCAEFTGPSGQPVTVSRDVTILKGATIQLSLCANPSTGFEWDDAVISDPSVLVEQSRNYIEPTVTMPGSSGLDQWVFEAVGVGDCTITLTYSQPWEGGQKDVWQFQLQALVN